MQLQGEIFQIGQTIAVTDKFKKRELIIKFAEKPEYPEYIKFEAQQDKTDILDKYQVGQIVDLDFNLRGRAWTNPKGETFYFNTLVVWKIANVGTPVAPAPLAIAPVFDMQELQPVVEKDDLPF